VGGNGALRWSGRLPLERQPAFATDDPETALAAATGLLGPHQMRLPDGAEGFCARVNACRWRDVMLSYFAYGAAAQITGTSMHGLYAVNLPVAGRADVWHRGALVQASPEVAAVFSVVGPVTMRWSADHAVLCLTIRQDALERHLSRMTGREISGPIAFTPAMTLGGGGASWRGVLQTLLDLAERASSPPPLVMAELETAVMTTLLVTQPHTYSDVLLSESPAPGGVVAAATEIMRDQASARLTVAEIARRVGVSERSLQLSFRRQLGLSPREQLRDLRLDQVRRELLMTSAEEKSVSRIAADWGFVHLSRFAASYRRKFGENPSRTTRGG
jgi:AraC-like DNA-binding protein